MAGATTSEGGRRSHRSDAAELRGRRRAPAERQAAGSSEDMEREEEEEEDSDEEEETQIPIEDQMTLELPATERDTSPPPVQRRSPPTSPPLPMAEALAGSPTGPVAGPPAASLSPFADVESTTPQSNEDEDSRSETSSEMSFGSGRTSRRRGTRKRVTTPCSDHRNLSERLKKAVVSDGEENFGEAMIGADVVLCVRYNEKRREANGNGNAASNCAKGGIRRFHAHRFILAASSPPFRAMLTGNMRESSRRDVELHDIEPMIVEKMLLFMYTGDVVLDLESVLGLLIAAEMYELVALREMCKGFVLKYAHEVFCDPQIVQLPEKILLELIPQDDLQIRELALMEALVMWGESRVANADKPLGDLLTELMEFVRFPTMSVSDLYGKVRPLVNDNVIREHLLTEALFNHLKWGSQTGIASKRAKPRALTASLRKRKRVSFTQHVTFETTPQGDT
ncbi:hypothetical protein PHPALM_9441 [Phytophthora palmivora]|uniref:BTB domain-containing protein n=1 Tax=Phytophthora palmivora TaxID=4796 RepID=A0A2P4Y7B0_9STRA|nr:hypothetical protein PHPALM_9441 [Phytophthora palmivora]